MLSENLDFQIANLEISIKLYVVHYGRSFLVFYIFKRTIKFIDIIKMGKLTIKVVDEIHLS